MHSLKNIEKANESNWLWPPVADAIDTFLRRREDADGYERIWRLIHVWESIVTTLCSVAVARLREAEQAEALYRRSREFLYGKQWNEIDRSFSTGQGALDGGIDGRIEVLRLIARGDSLDSAFLSKLRCFLSSKPRDDEADPTADGECRINLSSFFQVWGVACDTPVNPEREKRTDYTVIATMGHVNTFRNRYAHVPFPHDPIEKLAGEFEGLTERLFSIEPEPWRFESVLAGAFVRGQTLWRGGIPSAYSTDAVGDVLNIVWPPFRPSEVWDATPFIFIDRMKRPYVLTRLKNRETGTWEYTRYRAEASAVVTHDDENLLSMLPEPTEQEYPRDEEDDAATVDTGPSEGVSVAAESAGARRVRDRTEQERREQEPVSDFTEAIEAIRNGEFARAIPFFEELTVQRPNYHISWLRLGHARREKAARITHSDPVAAIELLQESIDALTKAAGHVEPAYEAQAYYERSKAHYRLWMLERADECACAARQDAIAACRLSPDTKYQTWLEHVDRILPSVCGR